MPLNGALCSAPPSSNCLGILFLLFLIPHPGHANPQFVPRLERDSNQSMKTEFSIYWNVPSFLCKKYNIHFTPLLQRFGIISNPGGNFRGSEINILYDPGMFPVYLKNYDTNEIVALNGGAPHKGNLEKHLEAFTDDVNKIISPDFEGLAVIDFESWRPIFRQNWNDQHIYKEVLIEEIKQKNSKFNNKKVNNVARRQFENVTRLFMENTLRKAKELRPKATWGYYAYPYCFNSKSGDKFECPKLIQRENDKIQWLFQESGALYPSLYMGQHVSVENHVKIVTGIMNEVQRVIRNLSHRHILSAFPYIRYNYRTTSNFLIKEDIYNVIITVAKYNLGGLIIWGSSNDFKSEKGCNDVLNYLQNTLGPMLNEARENFKKNIFTIKQLKNHE